MVSHSRYGYHSFVIFSSPVRALGKLIVPNSLSSWERTQDGALGRFHKELNTRLIEARLPGGCRGIYVQSWASLVAQMIKNLPAGQKIQVWSLGWEDLLEKGMGTHSSMLAQRIPWTEEPGRLQPTGSERAGHDWVTNTYIQHAEPHPDGLVTSSAHWAPTMFSSRCCEQSSHQINLLNPAFVELVFVWGTLRGKKHHQLGAVCLPRSSPWHVFPLSFRFSSSAMIFRKSSTSTLGKVRAFPSF